MPISQSVVALFVVVACHRIACALVDICAGLRQPVAIEELAMSAGALMLVVDQLASQLEALPSLTNQLVEAQSNHPHRKRPAILF